MTDSGKPASASSTPEPKKHRTTFWYDGNDNVQSQSEPVAPQPAPSSPNVTYRIGITCTCLPTSLVTTCPVHGVDSDLSFWRSVAFAAQKAIEDLTGIRLNDQGEILKNYHETRIFAKKERP